MAAWGQTPPMGHMRPGGRVSSEFLLLISYPLFLAQMSHMSECVAWRHKLPPPSLTTLKDISWVRRRTRRVCHCGVGHLKAHQDVELVFSCEFWAHVGELRDLEIASGHHLIRCTFTENLFALTPLHGEKFFCHSSLTLEHVSSQDYLDCKSRPWPQWANPSRGWGVVVSWGQERTLQQELLGWIVSFEDPHSCHSSV